MTITTRAIYSLILAIVVVAGGAFALARTVGLNGRTLLTGTEAVLLLGLVFFLLWTLIARLRRKASTESEDGTTPEPALGETRNEPMKPPVRRLLLVAAVVTAVGFLLVQNEGLASQLEGLHYSVLWWPLVSAGVFFALSILANWLQNDRPLDWVMRVTRAGDHQSAPARRLRGLALAVLARMLRDLAYLAALVGGFLFFPQIGRAIIERLAWPGLDLAGPMWQVIEGAAPWILAVLIAGVMLRAARIPFPVTGEIVRFPTWRLLALLLAWLAVTPGGLLTLTVDIEDPGLVLPLIAAFGLSYLGSTAGNAAATSDRWPSLGRVPAAIPAGFVKTVSVLAAAATLPLVLWAGLNFLPRISTFLLYYQNTQSAGWATMAHFSHVFDARWHIAGLAFALGLAWMVVSTPRDAAGSGIGPLGKAAALCAAGCLAWLVGTRLIPIGHGFLLLGGAVAAGTFVLAMAHLGRYLIEPEEGIVSGAARWLAASATRAFSLGAAFAVYGLLLRPIFYQVMWFAPLFEWLLVLAIGALVFNRIRSRLSRQVAAVEQTPARWVGWARHDQKVADRPDTHFEQLVAEQHRFVETGRWGQVWRYFLGLLLRNNAPLSLAQAAFLPLRRYEAENARWDPGPGKEKRTLRRREEALMETIQGVNTSLSYPAPPEPAIDEGALRELGQSFIDGAAGPDALAVTLTAAYGQAGVNVDYAARLWFPLATLVDYPIKWRHFPWQRSRIRRRSRERRQRMVDGALGHLYEGRAGADFPVGVITRELQVYDNHGQGVFTLSRGEAVEVIAQQAGLVQVRTGDHHWVQISSADLVHPAAPPRDSRREEPSIARNEERERVTA